MDKVLKVSISGMAFTLDEKAGAVLSNYLDTLSSYYKSRSCGNEIMEGIESRISELLIERGCREGIVTPQIAEDVVRVIGTPEEIFGASVEGGEASGRVRASRRFYRNPEGKMIAGVCSGISAYFNIDVVWPRLFFAVLLIAGFICGDWIDFAPFLSLLLYLVLWIVMPLARTASQRSQMRGESLSLDTIQRKAETSQNASSGSGGSGFLAVCAKIILIFFGCIFFIVGFSGVFALACVIFGLGIAGLTLPAALGGAAIVMGTAPVWAAVTIKILIAVVVFLPFAALLYGGVKLLFGFKTPVWRPGLVTLVVWLAASIALLIISIMTVPEIWNMITLQCGHIFV